MTLTLQKPTSENQHGAMLCRAAYSAPAAATAEVMYMPAGLQTITPSQGGRSVQVQVRVEFAKLAQDSSLVTFAAFQRPDLFERGSQDTSFAFPVHGFSVHESANLLPNNGNITGFGFSKSALVLAARVPNDYTSVLPGASIWSKKYAVIIEDICADTAST